MTRKRSVSINTFSVGRLMVQEDYGFQTLAKEAIAKLPLETSAPGFSPRLKQSVDEFNTAYGEFDDALQAAAALPSVAAAAKNDKERDEAWNAMYNFTKSTTRHPDVDVADIAVAALQRRRIRSPLRIPNRRLTRSPRPNRATTTAAMYTSPRIEYSLPPPPHRGALCGRPYFMPPAVEAHTHSSSRATPQGAASEKVLNTPTLAKPSIFARSSTKTRDSSER